MILSALTNSLLAAKTSSLFLSSSWISGTISVIFSQVVTVCFAGKISIFCLFSKTSQVIGCLLEILSSSLPKNSSVQTDSLEDGKISIVSPII